MVDEVMPRQAWQALLSDPEAVLVDVRTPGEWEHVGVPVLDAAGKELVLVSWQHPDGSLNRDFLRQLREAGVVASQDLYFVCRSGVRSLAAAHAAAAAGYERCTNVLAGFEGRPEGWKAAGLPCR